MQQSQLNPFAVFDRLAAIGRAVRLARAQKETGPNGPAAKLESIQTGPQTNNRVARRIQDSTPGGDSQQA